MKVYFKEDENILVIDGQKYTHQRTTYKKIGKQEHVDKHIFVKLDKEDKKKKTEFIKEKIKNRVSKEKVLSEIINNLQLSDLNKIYKILKTKKPKITRQDGCLGIEINGGKRNTAYIQLVE